MKRIINWILAVCIVTTMVSCNNDSFDKRIVIPEAEWRQEDRVTFDVDINKKGQKPDKLEDYAITKEAHTNTNEGYGEADLKKMSD